MALTVELTMHGTTSTTGRYVGWVPTRCALRRTDGDGGHDSLHVELRTRAGAGGKVAFSARRDDEPSDTLELELPTDGSPARFWVAGKFGSPSRADGDAGIAVRRSGRQRVIDTFPLMVRIRKNANDLTTDERHRLLEALARLNHHGTGIFQSFRDTHVGPSTGEAHGLDAFLPWHRAYILDLERALQRVDPSVTLPYWRFDRPAPKLFTAAFLGTGDKTTGEVSFAATNPLQGWATDGRIGFDRLPFFNTKTSVASSPGNPALSKERTTTTSNRPYVTLRPIVEGNPHGLAHVSFIGDIGSIPTAARDPLFFLLHCNVDRLWAKWQWFKKHFDPAQQASYKFRGRASDPGALRIGHNAKDTMWPWNNVTSGPRPNFPPPRTPFPDAPTADAPGSKPTVGAMIDYQGITTGDEGLGFDYDDVPYDPAP